MCGEASYVCKAKTKFRARLNNYKSAYRSHGKNIQKNFGYLMDILDV